MNMHKKAHNYHLLYVRHAQASRILPLAILVLGMVLIAVFPAAIAATSSYSTGQLSEDIGLLEKEIGKMGSSGINTLRLEEMVSDAHNALRLNNSAEVVKIIDDITQLKDRIDAIKERLEYEKGVIASLAESGMDVNETKSYYSKASGEFLLGNLEGAEISLQRSIDANINLLRLKYDYLNRTINYPLIRRLGISDDILKQKSLLLETYIKKRDIKKIKLAEEEILSLGETLSELNSSYARIQQQGHDDKRNQDHNILEYKDNKRFTDLFNDAIAMVELGRIEDAKKASGFLIDLFAYSEKIRMNIDSLEEKIREYRTQGINTSDIGNDLISIKEEFSKTNFEKAEKMLEKDVLALEDLKEKKLIEESLKKNRENSIYTLIMNHMTETLISFAIIILIAGLSIRPLNKRRHLKRAAHYRKEKETLKRLMISVQEKYYKNRIISKEEYNDTFDDLQEKLAQTIGKLKKEDEWLRKNGNN